MAKLKYLGSMSADAGISRALREMESPYPPIAVVDWESLPRQPIPMTPPMVETFTKPEEPSTDPVPVFSTSLVVQRDPNCCGVRHFAHMSETFQLPAGTPYFKQREAIALNNLLVQMEIEILKNLHPDLYKDAYEKWNAEIDRQCTAIRATKAATVIMHFVRRPGSQVWVAGILREVIKNRTGAVNMGEYKNPNTGNIINGWCIPTTFKRNNRLDKVEK